MVLIAAAAIFILMFIGMSFLACLQCFNVDGCNSNSGIASTFKCHAYASALHGDPRVPLPAAGNEARHFATLCGGAAAKQRCYTREDFTTNITYRGCGSDALCE